MFCFRVCRCILTFVGFFVLSFFHFIYFRISPAGRIRKDLSNLTFSMLPLWVYMPFFKWILILWRNTLFPVFYFSLKPPLGHKKFQPIRTSCLACYIFKSVCFIIDSKDVNIILLFLVYWFQYHTCWNENYTGKLWELCKY